MYLFRRMLNIVVVEQFRFMLALFNLLLKQFVAVILDVEGSIFDFRLTIADSVKHSNSISSTCFNGSIISSVSPVLSTVLELKRIVLVAEEFEGTRSIIEELKGTVSARERIYYLMKG